MGSVDFFKGVYSPGQWYSNYRIEECLTQLRNGCITYRAMDARTGKDVALKVFYSSTENARKLFQSEVQSLVQLKAFPGILVLQDYGEFQGTYFLTTEFIEGGSLRDYLNKRAGPEGLSAQEVIELFSPIAAAIDFCHGSQVVHRDLKPENVLLSYADEGIRPFISDFGISRKLLEDGSFQTTGISGSCQYLAPEAWDPSTHLTSAVDIYAFGTMIYEALEGKVPFPGKDSEMLKLMTQHLTAAIPYPVRAEEKTNKKVVQVILQTLEKKPEDRPRSARKVIEEVRQACTQCGEDFTSTWIGKRLPGYKILSTLGQGTMHYTFKARDQASNDLVVVKVFHSDSLGEKARKAFEEERSALKSLETRHGVLSLRDCGEENGVYYIVTDFKTDGSLREYLQGHPGGLPVKDVIELFTHIAESIDYIHGQNIVHRDLKPENIVLSKEQDEVIPFLTDFGIARIIANSEYFSTWTVTGTFGYMAPEAWDSSAHKTTAVDIYAFGVMLYEALEGKKPFDGEYPAIMYQHVNGPLPAPERTLRELGQDAASILLTTLAKDPEARPKTAAEIIDALTSSCPGIAYLGQKVKAYRIERYLGGTPIGMTFQATDERNNQAVALKLIPFSVAGTKMWEIEVIQKLKESPGILSIRDTGKYKGSYFVVTDYKENGNLRQLLKESGGRLSFDSVLSLFKPIAAAVDRLHEMNVIHRDLKPENVVLQKTGEVYEPFITDFGISRVLSGDTQTFRTISFSGTTHYMAPEAWTPGSGQNYLIDIYALGVMLYEAVEGKLPFNGEFAVIGYDHINTTPPYPAIFAEEAGRQAVDVLLSALAKSPEKRPQSAQAFIEGIEKWYCYHRDFRGAADLEGQTYHGYVLQKIVEQDLVSITYRGVVSCTNKPVIVRLYPGLQHFADANNAFQTLKARLASIMDQPEAGVANIQQFEGIGGKYFVVMDDPGWKTLREVFRDLPRDTSGGLPYNQAIHLLAALAAALEALRKRQIYDLGLRPENLLVSLEGVSPQILITNIAGPGIEESIYKNRPFSPYLAPEAQKAGAACSPAADVYTLGALLYEAIEGKLPWGERGETNEANPASGRVVRMGGQRAMNIIRRALEAAPEKRYPTASDFMNELQKATRPFWAKRKRLAAIFVILMLFTTASLAMVNFARFMPLLPTGTNTPSSTASITPIQTTPAYTRTPTPIPTTIEATATIPSMPTITKITTRTAVIVGPVIIPSPAVIYQDGPSANTPTVKPAVVATNPPAGPTDKKKTKKP